MQFFTFFSVSFSVSSSFNIIIISMNNCSERPCIAHSSESGAHTLLGFRD